MSVSAEVNNLEISLSRSVMRRIIAFVDVSFQ